MTYLHNYGLAQVDSYTWTAEIPFGAVQLCQWNSDWQDMNDTPLPTGKIIPNPIWNLGNPTNKSQVFRFLATNNLDIEDGELDLSNMDVIGDETELYDEEYFNGENHDCTEPKITYLLEIDTNQIIHNYTQTSITKVEVLNRLEDFNSAKSSKNLKWTSILQESEIDLKATWEEETDRFVEVHSYVITCCTKCLPKSRNYELIGEQDELDFESIFDYLFSNDWDSKAIEFYVDAFRAFWELNGTEDVEMELANFLVKNPSNPIANAIQDALG